MPFRIDFPGMRPFVMDLDIKNLYSQHPHLMSALLFGAGFAVATLLHRWRRVSTTFPEGLRKQAGQGDGMTTAIGEYKMVLIVRTDLKMGKGKIAAQCAHAAVGAVEKLAYENMAALRHWQRQGQPKVVLKVNDESSFFDLIKSAQAQNITTCLISDAGRTQIAPGSKTTLAVGPGPASIIDRITGHLKLL